MLSADPLDILFENRNKSYGAYPLRKYYSQRLYISFGVTLSFVVMGTFLYLFFSSNPPVKLINQIPDNYFDPVDLTCLKINSTSVKIPAARTPLATIPDIRPHKILKNKPDLAIATVAEVDQDASGVKALDGAPDNGGMQNNGSSAGTDIKAGTPVETKRVVLDIAEVMPEYPGGIEALKRYLVRNLRMPESNLEPGSTVHVIARFVVDEDGKVRDIELLRSRCCFQCRSKARDFEMPVETRLTESPECCGIF